jgi:uncharacterized membrane protein
MKNAMRRLIAYYHGRIIFTAGGIVLAFLIIHYGLLRTAFILALGGLGYFIGSRVDSNEDLRSVLERVLPPLN